MPSDSGHCDAIRTSPSAQPAFTELHNHAFFWRRSYVTSLLAISHMDFVPQKSHHLSPSGWHFRGADLFSMGGPLLSIRLLQSRRLSSQQVQ